MPRLASSALATSSCAALLACACASPSAPERVHIETLDSPAEGRSMGYSVYTPPGWDGETPLPLVIFLHGGGDDERVLAEKTAITATFDEWILAGRLDPFIMVAPNGERGFWANWYDGSHAYEDYVVDDVIPTVRARYPIAPGRENLHLMGISMGGAGTLFTSLHHGETFASATVLSAPIFDEQRFTRLAEGKMFRGMPHERLFGPPEVARETARTENPFAKLQTAADLHGTQLLIGAGRRDLPGLLRSNRKFHAHLEAAQIPHHYIEYRGGHDWRSWSQLFPVALCLHMRKSSCELEEDRFFALERDPEVFGVLAAQRASSPAG
ncbi:esterase family protein [Pseudenhygromyxa sp. WMMC2535]|uniref:alpha/beta hydrolase n=1 Tax=Pseudenhygromyxa sp. WMMC2535 TaxID=2712867 RepID=UPI001555D68D|nr:alpha/beta hydrolase-fold protein [Pseudenhygromyxa sp. WMMC2535]NVB42529.1 esterase family protein [Pseudenhygromyxa sp. WMMC2535]